MASDIVVSPVVEVPRTQISSGFSTQSIRPSLFPGLNLNPFISADHFMMSEPTFPPHPHAGFSAVTYMFEHSPGGFINRDSFGDRSEINPGDLHWTMAASGLMHEEVPKIPGILCEGIQLFVNLSAQGKKLTAKAFHLENQKANRIQRGHGEIKILSGIEKEGVSGLLIPERFDFLDINLTGPDSLSMQNPKGFSTVLYFYKGSGKVSFENNEHRNFIAGQAVALSSGVDAEYIITGKSKLLVFRAPVLNEPVAFGGPFIMNSPEEIRQAQMIFRSGGMGHLDPSFD